VTCSIAANVSPLRKVVLEWSRSRLLSYHVIDTPNRSQPLTRDRDNPSTQHLDNYNDPVRPKFRLVNLQPLYLNNRSAPERGATDLPATIEQHRTNVRGYVNSRHKPNVSGDIGCARVSRAVRPRLRLQDSTCSPGKIRDVCQKRSIIAWSSLRSGAGG